MPNENKPTIYTVATAHLDTSWLWTLETTIAEYIPATLNENFAWFEKYPDYTFSFEGAYRYELMEEYYPELFGKLKEYVAKGRWRVAGSAYENGDVNTPSPEALLRNILLGNRYFAEKFGKRSVDIYLPDCFGFGRALPGIAAHANLKGFTTQKLTWGSASKVPFPLGRWQGPDGGEIFACPDGHTYVGSLRNVRKNKFMRYALGYLRRHKTHQAALILHGVGDRGGAPKEKSVVTVCGEVAENDSNKIIVKSAGSDDIFRDLAALPREEQQKLPLYQGEWLLTDHGTGCYTARLWSKRWNRQAEQLAAAAEHANAYAGFMGRLEYPKDELNIAWKRVISHQFHDDMTGTSLEVCYPRNWNDLMVSQQEFARMYTQGVSAVAGAMNTGFAVGRCVAVSNVTQWARSEAVQVRLLNRSGSVRVLDSRGNEVPSQLSRDNASVIFLANAEPLSVTLFDIQTNAPACALDTGLQVSKNCLENQNLRVQIDENGDISSLYSKSLGRECLKAPVRLAMFRFDGSPIWPQWELYYPELKKKARYPGSPEIELLETGPARAAISVTRKYGGSIFRQVISLDASGEYVRVDTDMDWRSLRTLLKVEAPLAAADQQATYDIGFGVARRGNNTRRSYEVPAQQWADISDTVQNFGVSILSDSKTGWDKPNDHTLRLTAVYTPRSGRRGSVNTEGAENGPYPGTASDVMDFGRSSFAFGLFPHAGGWQNGSIKAGACFGQKLAPFYPNTQLENSGLPAMISFGRVGDGIVLRALKQSEENEGEWIARVQEANGESLEKGELRFGNGILECREVYASEEPRDFVSELNLDQGTLRVNLKPFEIRTFACKIAPVGSAAAITRTKVMLPLERQALPSGLYLPDGTAFLRCAGQKIALPAGKELHLTIASFEGDKEAAFGIGGMRHARTVFAAREYIGAADMPGLNAGGYVKNAGPVREFWHLHDKDGKDMIGAQAWFFDVALPLAEGARELTLPIDSAIVLLDAYVQSEATAATAAPLFDQMERLKECSVKLTPKEAKTARTPLALRMARMGIRNGLAALRVRFGIDFRL